MSLSDVLRRGCESGGFEPLGSHGETAEPVDEDWRPLFEEMASDDAGEFDGRLVNEAGDGPRYQGESEMPENGDGSSSEESTQTFEAGYELGRQETKAELESLAESLVQSVEGLGVFRVKLRERYERELLELALAVARKIIHAEVGKNPEIWLRVISEGINNAVDREEVRVRVPTALATFFTDHLPEMRARLDEVKELVIVEDPALKEGGCVIESRFGELDVGMDAQIDHLQGQLRRIG